MSRNILRLPIAALMSLALALPLLPPQPAAATVLGVFPGDLIKLQDDHNPQTHEDEAVYYFDKDWFRHPFPNQRVFLSWYRDFSGVKSLSTTDMADIRMGAPVTYRPGTRLVKIPSIPKVYAVEPGGTLRWITSESVAKDLYGTDWSKRVDDVPEAFFVNYKEGEPLRSAMWPTGTLVRDPADQTLYIIDGYSRRHVTATEAESLRLDEADALDGSTDIEKLPMGPSVMAGGDRLSDTAELSRIETLPPLQIDFPAPVTAAARGAEQVLLSMRLTAGAPVTLRRLTAELSGPVRLNGQPLLTDLRFEDAAGGNVFGTIQLPADSGDDGATLVWDGALTLKAGTEDTIKLLASVSADMPAGANLKIELPRSGSYISDGFNADASAQFAPLGELPETKVTFR